MYWKFLVANKRGASRLGFALLFKFFESEARFPQVSDELPAAAVEYMAKQVKVSPHDLAAYAWSGRTIEYHRAQIRRAFGFREATRGDEAKPTRWLGEEVAASEPSDQALPKPCWPAVEPNVSNPRARRTHRGRGPDHGDGHLLRSDGGPPDPRDRGASWGPWQGPGQSRGAAARSCCRCRCRCHAVGPPWPTLTQRTLIPPDGCP